VTPPVRTLLRSCLVKDRRQRVADMSTILFVLGNAASLTAAGPGNAETITRGSTTIAGRGWRYAAAVAAVALVVGAAATALYYRRALPAPSIEQPAVRLSFVPPTDVALASGVNQLVPVVSPDGRRLAFSASRLGEPVRILVRSLESLDAQSLPGTENGRGPFWSPDSRTLAFFADEKLKAIDLSGGVVQTLCDAPNSAANPGASWSREGSIVFARRTGGLFKVASAGGVADPATVVDPANGDSRHAFPVFLPDGNAPLRNGLAGPLRGRPPAVRASGHAARPIVRLQPSHGRGKSGGHRGAGGERL
jgi:hypothetical protein